eukprot:TRINITY_DN794_c0_g2_i2.p1 TRINITY_DN794_c0_g2~~TRINITY_DN794_c0_g2_i2.p1  ORF type:complete len:228 (+),score=26.46 TRINITY_DN794_c0_g2_i2:66-749(+)
MGFFVQLVRLLKVARRNASAPKLLWNYIVAFFTRLYLMLMTSGAGRKRAAEQVSCLHKRALLVKGDSMVNNPENFAIVSYNILAPTYTIPRFFKYLYVSAAHLEWSYRLNLVLKEIQLLNADIACMQEVEETLYHDGLESGMRALGYVGVYTRKTDGRPDGVATFVRSSRYQIVDNVSVQFDTLITEICKEQRLDAVALKLITGTKRKQFAFYCFCFDCPCVVPFTA